MKVKVFTFFMVLLACNTVFGAGICLPELPRNASYARTITGNGDNNRGYWGIGTNCRVPVGDDPSGRPVICENPIMYGESHCSKYGTYTDAGWDQYGPYCWCRMTHLRTTQRDANGKYVVAPQNGAWVYVMSNQYCDTHCAMLCSNTGYGAKSWNFLKTLMLSRETYTLNTGGENEI